MEESIEIPVTINGEDYSFKAKLASYGYSHRIEVQLNDQAILLEPDEERKYRVVNHPDAAYDLSTAEQAILKEIIQVLDSLV